MKGILFIGMIAAYMIVGTVIVTSANKNTEPESEDSTWCFYAEYQSLKQYDQTNKPPHTYIELQYGKAKVYVPCDDFNTERQLIPRAHAAAADTSVTVTITAEVPCNEYNCLEKDEPVQVQTVKESWWKRLLEMLFWGYVVDIR